MPANFPEVWESRVRQILTTQDIAPWLDGIPELDGEVMTLGQGTATEKNIIHVSIETLRPEVLINNNTYPLDIQVHEDGSATITLDKYQTRPTSISDDAAMGASYDKIDSTTNGHRRETATSKNKKAIHALAPLQNSVNTPVLAVAADGDVFNAMADLATLMTKADFPIEGRRIVFQPDHVNWFLKNKERFANLFVDHNTGKLSQTIAGFECYAYLGMPMYTSAGVKKAYGAVAGAGDKMASVAFCVNNVGKKTGTTKIYFSPASANPTTQTNIFSLRHYFIATPVELKYYGAII
ncbi:hypothetical protein Q765_00255 [Flavobacterium rivuli WB 3.3-2 = DSM 21788]|uniref:Uncharacterized protein n=1 Tax=Flavobacterium rivuli WB 3.3-2 = DSM 21788 TaxID=1121895 RepID=A0A0A2M6V6_9FLAO|nr:hypothetical protein [Flavobacterium rivuli]KGO88387.1 hypothetical protein Q765_00255 [Flavobacterium rivuli WB 3.3-2 = DSM 21788]